jgi:hypothetical protein
MDGMRKSKSFARVSEVVPMDNLEIFCRQVHARSNDHRNAIRLLHSGGISSQIVSILREKLDSMIRVIYLLSISDMAYRDKLIKASVEGHKWTEKGSNKPITDRKMVDLANKLQGWTESVYRFGCGFIHLSSFHDYKERDPMDIITAEEKENILKHMRYYHGGPLESEPKFDDLIFYLPMVFEKIAENLECYVRNLESGKILDQG